MNTKRETKKKTIKKEKLYPVKYNDKLWYENDCDEIFISFYHTVYSLNGNGGVYLSEGLWVYPDGSMCEW